MTRSFHLIAAALVSLCGVARAQDDDILGDIDENAKPAEAPASEPEEDVEPEPAKKPTETIKATAAPAAATQADAGATESSPAALDRVKAVQRKPVLKRLRAELSPMASMSLNDAFYTHYAAGAGLLFYPHDNFAFGASGLYLYGHPASDNLDVVRQGQTSVPATFELPMLLATVDLFWIPIYGKLSLFDSAILHFDFYVTSGFGIVRFEEGNRMPTAAAIGLGQRFLLSDWVAFRVEVRDYLYLDTQDVAGQRQSDIQSYLMLNAGLSFFVPPSSHGGL